MTTASQDLPTLRVLHHLARTGGTLISKCLATMEGNLLLSEIHPFGKFLTTPVRQAAEWFGLFSPDEAAALLRSPLPFAEEVRRIHERARKKGQNLILRDWTHMDFTGVPFLAPPPMQLTTIRLLDGHFRVVHTATVRHPIDQFLSVAKIAQSFGKPLPLELFLCGVRRFAEQVADHGIVRYEDFTRDPDGQLAVLCDRLELPFDPGYRERWSAYTKVTGDDEGKKGASTTIAPRPRKPVDPDLVARFGDNADYREAIRIMGYGHPE